MIHCFLKPSYYRTPARIWLCIMLGVNCWAAGQRRNPLLAPTGFDDVVFAVCFSPDARTLAIARGAAEPSQRFGRIELWDTETEKLRHVIKGFDGPVKSISFSPDGQTLISASVEYRSSKIQEKARSHEGLVRGELKWWDGQTGELKQKLTLPGEGSSNLRVSFSPDGKDLVLTESFMIWSFLSGNPTFQPPGLGNTGPFPATPTRPVIFFSSDIKLLDARTGELKTKFSSDQSPSVIYSPDGALLAVAQGKEVKLLNAQTGKEERKLKGFKGKPNALAFSPNSRILAVASTNYDHEDAGRFIKIIGRSTVKLLDLRSGNEMLKLTEVGAVNTLAFSANGKVLLMGGVMGQGEKQIPGLNLFNLETGKIANFPTGEDFTEAVDSLSLSNNGALLAFRTGPMTVKMLDTKTLKVKQTLDEKSVGSAVERPVSRFLVSLKRVLAVAFSADGMTVAAETDQGEIKLWDPRTGEVKKQLSNDLDDPSLVTVSADGRSFAEISNGKLLRWNARSTTKQIVPLPQGHSISALALTGDGQTLALGSGNEVLLCNSAGTVVKKLSGGLGQINSLAFSEDGRALASVAADGRIELWNVATAQVERTIAAGSGVTALRFAPDGQALATATLDQQVILWNLQTGQAQARLEKHDAPVNALAFSADGQLLASGGDDRKVVIWATASGKSKRTLKGHDQTVTSLAFSPDGRLLATGSGNASVVLWDVRSGKLSRVLK